MSPVAVVTDSSCDLPEELAARHQVGIVPLSIRFGQEEFVDRRDLSPGEFWARCTASNVLPETSAPSSGAFGQAFRRAAEAGADGVVCVTISARLSATGQAAEVAARDVQDVVAVRVVDSRSVTMGLGLVVLAAAGRAEDGGRLDEVAQSAVDAAGRTHVYGALDTLENLKKGGRIGGAKALLGSMLSVKPIIEVRDGAVEAESRQRTRSRALRHLAEKVTSRGDIEQLAVMHAQAPDVEDFVAQLAPHHRREDIVLTDIGAVIGTHTGPGAIGIAFRLGSGASSAR